MPRLNAEELDLLGRVVEKPELQPFFFRKVQGLKWFDELEKRGFFAPENNPPPTPAKEPGYVSVPFWPAIEYLVSIRDDLLQDEAYSKRVLAIVRAATNYAKEHGYSNYRTWW